MRGSTTRGKNRFQDSWLQKYSWAKKMTTTHLTRTLCNSDINFVNIGDAALRKQENPNKKAPIK